MEFAPGLAPEKLFRKWFGRKGFLFHVAVTPSVVEACATLGGPFPMGKNMLMMGPKFCIELSINTRGLFMDALNRLTDLADAAELGESTSTIQPLEDLASSNLALLELTQTVLNNEQTQNALVEKASKGLGIKVSVAMELHISIKKEPTPMKLRATVAVEPGRVLLQGNMEYIWCTPFGIKGVCIGNLDLSIGIGATLVPNQLAFGGVLGLGPKCKQIMKPKKRKTSLKARKKKGKKRRKRRKRRNTMLGDSMSSAKGCVSAVVYVGLDAIDPTGNYFSARFSRIMLSDIVRWAMPNAKLGGISKFMDSTGFPDGLAASFAHQEQILGMDGTIPAGFAFAGTMQVMGYKGKVAVLINKAAGTFECKIEVALLTAS